MTGSQRCSASADIFIQGYRPGAIAQYGFSAEDAARMRPGIVCVSLCAYGYAGPWAGRRGFNSLVQNANGLNVAEAEAAGEDKPQPLPCQALDHATGYLMAFGAMTALQRRVIKGGSWHVRCSLAQTGHWFRHLGRIENGLGCPDPSFDDVRDRLEEGPSGFGRLTAVRHSAESVGDAGALGTPLDAARQPRGGMAEMTNRDKP